MFRVHGNGRRLITLAATAVALSMASVTPSAQSQASFSFSNIPINISTETDCLAGLKPGDFNGDGKTDMVAFNNYPCDWSQRYIKILVGQGGTSFASPTIVQTGDLPNVMDVCDLNGDGFDDIVLAGFGYSNPELLVLMGSPSGITSVTNRYNLTYGIYPNHIKVQDMNGDGSRDVLLAAGDGLKVFPGAGDGTFGAPVVITPSDSGSVAIGDFNGDGKMDLLQAQNTNFMLRMWVGNGTGWTQGAEFAPAHEARINISSMRSIAVADFNRDGKDDFTYPVYGNNGCCNSYLGIAMGQADLAVQLTNSTFVEVRDDYQTTGPNPGYAGMSWMTTAHDYNGDGNLDIIFETYLNSSQGYDTEFLVSMAGHGDGTFEAPAHFGPVGRSQGLFAYDFDGNNTLDLAIMGSGWGFSILSNDLTSADNECDCTGTGSGGGGGGGGGGGTSDTTPPVISDVPADITVAATSESGASVAYTVPTANDAVSGSVAVACVPASGATFSVGTATVTCTASDAAGNSASASFSVTVSPYTPPPPTIAQLLADLVAMVNNVGPGNSLTAKSKAAQQAYASGNNGSAAASLNALLNEVKAQTGKKITAAQAAAITSLTNQILALL